MEKENRSEEVAVATPIEGGESSFSNLEEKCVREFTGPGILVCSRTLRLLHTYSHGRL